MGFGGVGKTTLLREITARLADKEGVSTAGIDFDFLTADYPLTRPVELLSQFASELRLQDDSGLARSEFASFDDSVRVLNERLDKRSGFAASPAAAFPSRGRGAGLSPAAAIAGDDALREIIETFALGLEALNRRVVLLLDTCEELARLRPDGTAPASVEVTFDILEPLHDRVPSVRVVFCGRRPLASKGGNWSAVGSRLAVRPYLRLHEVRGFDGDGAEDSRTGPDPVRKELRQPILDRTGSVDDTVRFHYTAPDDGPVIGIKRYNPFELALYGRWAKDAENPPTVSEIKDPESDPYVAARLVGPLQDEVLSGLARDRGHARPVRPRGRGGRQRPHAGPLPRRVPMARRVGVDRRAARRMVRGRAGSAPAHSPPSRDQRA